MKVGFFLKESRNGFGLIRVVLASMVVWGHSAPAKFDILARISGHHMGAVAVKGFFFLSGLLVANSLLQNPNPAIFIRNRFCRIWPGLAACVLVTAFVIGPLFTALPARDYFSGGGPFLYVWRMLTLQSWGTQSLGYHNLPGLFEGLPWTSNANPPLWSIAPEVFSYAVLLAAFLAIGSNRKFLLIAAGFCIGDTLLTQRVLFSWLPSGNEDFSLLPLAFGCGVAVACLKDSMRIALPAVAAFWVLYALIFRYSPFEEQAFSVCFFATMLAVAFEPHIAAIKLPGDPSYGIYLWGFPIQHILGSLTHFGQTLTFAASCLTLAICAGFTSWFLIEKPAMKLRFAALRRSPALAEPVKP